MAEGIKCKSCGGRIMGNKCVNCGTVYTNKQVEEMANSSSKQIVHKKIDLKMSRVNSTDKKKSVTSSTKQTKQNANVQVEPEKIKKVATKKIAIENTDTQKTNKPKKGGNRLAQQTKSLKKEALQHAKAASPEKTTNSNLNVEAQNPEIIDEDDFDIEMPDTEMPDMVITDEDISDLETPSMEIPDEDVPNMEVPDMEITDEDVHDVETSDIETPDEDVLDVETPDMETPDEDVLDVETPDMETPDEDISDFESEIDDYSNEGEIEDDDYIDDDDGFEDVGKTMYPEDDLESDVDDDDPRALSDELDDNSENDFQNEEPSSQNLEKNKGSYTKTKKQAHLEKEKVEEKADVSVIDKIKKKRALSKAKKIEQIEGDLDYDFNSDGFYDDIELTDKSLPSYFTKRDFINAFGFIAFMVGTTILLIYNV